MRRDKTEWPHSGHGRCKAWETRYMPTRQNRRRTNPKQVRCMEPLGHDTKVTPHTWRGRAFGTTEKGKR